MARKFIVKHDSIEIKHNDYRNVKECCAVIQDWGDPMTDGEFDTLEEAREELKKYATNISDFDSHYLVTEYFIEEMNIEYDEDGDVEHEEIIAFHDITEMEIELVERGSYDTIAKFDNLEEATAAKNETERECFISFR